MLIESGSFECNKRECLLKHTNKRQGLICSQLYNILLKREETSRIIGVTGSYLQNLPSLRIIRELTSLNVIDKGSFLRFLPFYTEQKAAFLKQTFESTI